MINTEGLDNDNNMMIRERRTGGESSPEPAEKSLNMGAWMKSTLVFSVFTGWNEVCEQGWESLFCVGNIGVENVMLHRDYIP
jgi:hypothetical protein